MMRFSLVYLLTFLESFGAGLTGLAFGIYLKHILGLTDVQSGWFLLAYGAIFTLVTPIIGKFSGKIGVKSSLILGSSLLALSRLGLGFATSLSLATMIFILAIIGSSVKNSSLVTILKLTGGSFQYSYLVMNAGYALSGFVFDWIGSIPNTYLVAALIAFLNASLSFLVTNYSFETSNKYEWSILKKVLVLNFCLLFVETGFLFFNNTLPKLLLDVFGPSAPIGKIAGSLNPIIITLVLPVVAWYRRKFNPSIIRMVIFGSSLATLSFYMILAPVSLYYAIIAVIVCFTLSEAIFSPASVELVASVIPKGHESTYMGFALIPRFLAKIISGPVIGYAYTAFIPDNPEFMFFLSGLIISLTPTFLYFIYKKHME